MKEEVFKISVDGESFFVECSDKDKTVMAVSDSICRQLESGDKTGLNLLFSSIVHVLARDAHGKFLEDFVQNLRKIVPIYREAYISGQKDKKIAS